MDKVQERVRNDQEILSSLGDVIRSEEIPVQSGQDYYMIIQKNSNSCIIYNYEYYDDPISCLPMFLF